MTKKELLDDLATAEKMISERLVQVREMEQDCARYEHTLKDFLKRSLEEKHGVSVDFKIFHDNPTGYRLQYSNGCEDDLKIEFKKDNKVENIVLRPKDCDLGAEIDALLKKAQTASYLASVSDIFEKMRNLEGYVKKAKTIAKRLDCVER